MKQHTELVYCVRCMKYKVASKFSIYYAAKKIKVRECDKCHNTPLDLSKTEKKDLHLTPVQKALSNTNYAAEVRGRKKKIDAILLEKELKKLDEEYL